jgi:hypothetical protein
MVVGLLSLAATVPLLATSAVNLQDSAQSINIRAKMDQKRMVEVLPAI